MELIWRKQQIKLKKYDGHTNEKKMEAIMLPKSTAVLFKFSLRKILFIYVWGPFHCARPTNRAITAMVKMTTNLPGLVMMLKIWNIDTKINNPLIPNAIKALEILFSSGKHSKNLENGPVSSG